MYVPTYQVYSYTTCMAWILVLQLTIINIIPSPDLNIESPLLLLLLNIVLHFFVDSTLLPAVVFCSTNDITIKNNCENYKKCFEKSQLLYIIIYIYLERTILKSSTYLGKENRCFAWNLPHFYSYSLSLYYIYVPTTHKMKF